jgi:hypothetical protein
VGSRLEWSKTWGGGGSKEASGREVVREGIGDGTGDGGRGDGGQIGCGVVAALEGVRVDTGASA